MTHVLAALGGFILAAIVAGARYERRLRAKDTDNASIVLQRDEYLAKIDHLQAERFKVLEVMGVKENGRPSE